MTLNLLVTGATGFVGRHLTEFLSLQAGVRLRAVSRRGGNVGPTLVDAVNLELPGALEAWSAAAPRFDAVFHLAARVPGHGIADSESLLLANLAGTRSALALAEAHGAFMVYASSAFIYEPGDGEPVTESQTPHPGSYYHSSKLAGEQLCRASVHAGVPGVQLRIAAVYGPGQVSPTVLQLFVTRAKVSQDLLVHGSGRRTQDFVHVDDVVRAMWQAFLARSDGPFHVASGASIAMWDLATLVRACVPETGAVVRFSGQPDPQENARWVFSIARARAAFGFEPRVRLEDGIRQLARMT